MSNPILVTYATRYGSTRAVAETVAATLREQGTAVDLKPMSDVQTLDGYDAVVMGAPIYIGHWLKDALRFLARQRDALAGRAVAIFALGPLHDDPKEFQDVRAQFDQELAQFSTLTPIAVALFGGTYDPSRLRFSDRLLAILPASPLHGMPASDARDWEAIRAWARDLATKLQSVAT